MKKMLVLLTALVLLFASCAEKPPHDDKTPMTGGGETTEAPAEETNNPLYAGGRCHSSWVGWSDDEKIMQGIVNADAFKNDDAKTHLPLYSIDSEEALEKFISDYGDVFSIDQAYDGGLGFVSDTMHCNADFFDEKLLLIAYMGASSGAYRYSVRDITVVGNELAFDVEQKNDPEECTDDMSGWLLTAEVERKYIEACTSLDAVYVGKKGEGFDPYDGIDFPSPPILTVFGLDEKTEALYSNAHWWSEDGGVMTCGDGFLDGDFVDKMPYLSNDGFGDIEGRVYGRLHFNFERQPRVTITRWRLKDIKQGNYDEEENVTTDDGIRFPMNRYGSYVYCVSADWEKIDQVGGSVDYYFCVGDSEEYFDPNVPPALKVVIPNDYIRPVMGEGSWTCKSDDGKIVTKNFDSAYPVSRYFLDELPMIANEDHYFDANEFEAKLVFDSDRQPEVTIRRWNVETVDRDDIEASSETVEVRDGTYFNLNRRDTYVYEVTAVWDGTDGVGGKLTYAFYVGPTPKFA